ncbi:hypothetical protein MGYG_08101 [Nannizzia gypsea CBS 118893]|uniref:Uncharacterized protein n=1 Tax=Arthroderma gypseum (strain ATCC MYA-4604 / CBS 118893) TaxID=535722 RepID=E4V518_ARTGP|nr:hypothetical protein MGYG_08101 [Nannizzia gypsea CBS 118893]EFR05092.1 hypothetical protein MGYG_08101 [Nannizzia gypsea CBS 118893]
MGSYIIAAYKGAKNGRTAIFRNRRIELEDGDAFTRLQGLLRDTCPAMSSVWSRIRWISGSFIENGPVCHCLVDMHGILILDALEGPSEDTLPHSRLMHGKSERGDCPNAVEKSMSRHKFYSAIKIEQSCNRPPLPFLDSPPPLCKKAEMLGCTTSGLLPLTHGQAGPESKQTDGQARCLSRQDGDEGDEEERVVYRTAPPVIDGVTSVFGSKSGLLSIANPEAARTDDSSPLPQGIRPPILPPPTREANWSLKLQPRLKGLPDLQRSWQLAKATGEAANAIVLPQN